MGEICVSRNLLGHVSAKVGFSWSGNTILVFYKKVELFRKQLVLTLFVTHFKYTFKHWAFFQAFMALQIAGGGAG